MQTMKDFIMYVSLFINFTSLAFYLKNKWDL
nr:MAG TPA_asm: amino acid transporter [Caudoviricetes sp.]